MKLVKYFTLAAGVCAMLGSTNALQAQTASSSTHQDAEPAANRPSASITVSPAVVAPGQTATLTWNSSNASSVTIDGLGVPNSGAYSGAPPQTMTFSMSATGKGGTTTAQATVTVQAPPPPKQPSTATPGTPHINYTDLNVGSGTGGDTGNGVYVRVFGTHFGASQGGSALTLGGNLVTDCRLCSWNDNEIVAQLGPAAKTGNIVVSVNGQSSNGVPFTVTPTTILYVAANGSDNNPGTYAAPFKSWRAAFNSVTGNDNQSPAQNTVIYLEPGANVSQDDGRGYHAAISTDIGGSSATKQLSIVGFPGGTVNVGSTGVEDGVHGWGKYITLANLTIVGGASAIDAESGNIRMVNNDLSCPAPPNGIGGTACVLGETDSPSDNWVFDGNYMHNTGGNVSKTYHAVYFSSNVNHAEVGWNNIGQNFQGYCRSIMFHATEGANQFDLHVHDNLITGGYCDGIAFASADPSQGTVEAYNNVITHVATANNPYGVANEAGIAINTDPAGGSSGQVQVYGNTVVDAGGYTEGNQNGCFGVVSSGAGMNLVNNICVQPAASQPYIEKGSTGISGSNNLWFGAGSVPSWDRGGVGANPLFVSGSNFSLDSNSPAIGAGTSDEMAPFDIVGTVRANPPAIGAYQ